MTDPIEPQMGQARAALARAQSIVVLTGAGVSAESGIPTFRGDGGYWKDLKAEDLASQAGFDRDPRLVWEWYGERRKMVMDARPNEAHYAIAKAARTRPTLRVVTQNIDGLHTRAALAQEARHAVPIELHGSLFRKRCTACGLAEADLYPVDATSVATLPKCGACGTLARPDIVWFGESLDRATLNQAGNAADCADVCLVIGTSGLVVPAALLPNVTIEAGGQVIEVNPEPTAITDVAAISLRGKATEIVPRLFEDGV
jgi:NAD-dependent deacetylase